MEADVNPTVISVVLILMAVASLFTMISLNQINYIVHGDLYDFGLRFSYRWAMPYWIFSGIIFGLSWVNIAISIIVTLYLFNKSRKQTWDSETPLQESLEEKEQRKLSEYIKPQQEEELPTPKEEPVETSSEEFVEEEVRQPEEPLEVAEAHETQESQVDRAPVEEEAEPSRETEEVPIPPEDIEQRQSVL